MPRLFVFVGVVAAAVACAPRPATESRAAELPPGWLAVPPPAAGTAAALCADLARDEWKVTLTSDSSARVLDPVTDEPRADTAVADDSLLVGDDMRDFGGVIWWVGRDGRCLTIAEADGESSLAGGLLWLGPVKFA